MRTSVRSTMAVVLALAVASCGQQETGPGSDTADTADIITSTSTTLAMTTTTVPSLEGTPVVIDTDMAAEGVMSILYLLGRPELDVRAITVSGTGLVHCEPGVAQVLGLLELVGAGDIPVACGPEEPLAGRNTFPTSWRAGADDLFGVELPRGGEPADLDAPALLASVIGESPVPVAVYADGPQTNLALALGLDPTIVDKVATAYVMGGAFDVPGNGTRNPAAEWNIWVDPVAADEVFRSGMPITLVPLDATNQVPLNIFHLAALEAHQDSPAARAVVEMLRANEQVKTGGLYFWDQLTAALLADESYGTYRTENVEVVLADDRTVAGSTRISPTGTSLRIVDTVDRRRFESDFLSALVGTDVGPIVIDADWEVSFDGTTWSGDLPDTATTGEYTLLLTNEGEGTAAVALGWLTGDATVADLDAWEGIDQPPFFELDSIVAADPHSENVTVVSLTSVENYLVVGIDLVGEQATRIGGIEVSE